jgi:hypothetical protein
MHRLLVRTLAGLPEMELFESEHQRNVALDAIGRDVTPARSGWWQGFLLVVGVPASVFLLFRFFGYRMLRTLGAPGWLGLILPWVLAAASLIVVLRWAHRSGLQSALREHLIACRIPVCRACGYCVRGLQPQATRCPECGRALDADVLALIKTA